ncbi:MAG TPA: acetyl-CoA carboxylase biotin carboxyl carrier protein [Saprospiraceae bacterium]|nr:acetyl-CoA carboxylase biotin carboxyl carrier protein [Saprospiraceae bacterium]HMQ82439.1 acetyl-CoA carboxylase biotin carboxyl carrier protein [Saprospiraceae bacterium]
MTFKEIQELIRLVGKSNLTEFKMKQGDFEITLRTDKYEKGKVQALPQALPIAQAPVLPATVSTPVSPASAPVHKAPASPEVEAPAAASSEDESQYIAIKSPMIGTFYRSPSPEKPPYIKVGDTVEAGQVVCIVEAMKLFNEIESEVSGKVVKVVTEDAQPVEYDQVLFLIDPKG